jgi:hypothetical protein
MRLSLATLALLAAGCGSLPDAREEPVGSTSSDLTATDVSSLALANVGKLACSTNSLGGKAFDSSCTGNGGSPEYWCADFARWVWENAGAKNTSELTAAAGSFYVYGQNHGTLKSTPSLGDAVVFNYAGNGYADHVALVTKVNTNGTIETVSGDWNGQSGTEAQFASTSHAVLNTPAYAGTVGSSPGIMGMKISGFVAPVGLDVPYAASYVSQSFPLASTALTMVEGQTIPSFIELKNTGTKTWDSNTRLGTTQPRDRNSVFADSSWTSPSRPSSVTGTVAPGASYKFDFALHAPDKAGTYYEYFGVVQEGVAWFSDAAQGGPADDMLEIQVKVIEPEYRGTFKQQSFPMAPAPLAVHQGDVVDGFIELTNTGTEPWKAGTTKLAPTPRDKPSAFADPSWLSSTRVATLAADVPPNGVGHFDVKLDANDIGDFEATFGLVEDGVTWFADAPLGGGPDDGLLRVHLVVVAKGAPLDAGVVPASDGGTDADGGTGSQSPNGCAMSAAPTSARAWDALGLAFAMFALGARRRHCKKPRSNS